MGKEQRIQPPLSSQRAERRPIPNVLDDRYASEAMHELWSPESKILFERDLWIAVIKAQSKLGLDIPISAIAAYEAARDTIDMHSIRQREAKSKHDVKSRIDEFNAIAGGEFIHRGMTSRDLTDNVEQIQNKEGLIIVRDRAVATLARFSALAIEHEATTIAARTHNVPAQPTLMGKRFAMWGEELLSGFIGLEELIERYPLRGIKGAVGTQTDQLQLLRDPQKVQELEKMVAQHLGFKNVLGNVGQIYPRSLDFEVVARLYQITAGPSNFARGLRLMAGQEQMAEGFGDEQSGSSAMPHKMNARTSERVNGFTDVMKGYVVMAASISGGQWYEGDVSDSVVRRIALQDAFLATDGLFENVLTVLDELTVYPAVVSREFERYFPFLTSTRVLMEAVKNGVGRETAHKVIKQHATAVAKHMKEGLPHNNLFDLLAGDERLGLTRSQIASSIETASDELVGNASEQVKQFVGLANSVVERNPQAALYMPRPIL